MSATRAAVARAKRITKDATLVAQIAEALDEWREAEWRRCVSDLRRQKDVYTGAVGHAADTLERSRTRHE